MLNTRGANISAMDIHPVVGDFLKDNTELNGMNDIPFHNASWSDAKVELGYFDLVIGSDILYEPVHVKKLSAFMDRHVGPCGEVIVMDPDRGQGGKLHDDMISKGFNCNGFRTSFRDHFDAEYSGSGYRFYC